jgi:hypothetical protein
VGVVVDSAAGAVTLAAAEPQEGGR